MVAVVWLCWGVMDGKDANVSHDAWRAGRWAVWIVVALLAYVLSVGPATVLAYCYEGLFSKGPGTVGPVVGAYGILYAPLFLGLREAPGSDPAYETYLRWWFHLFGVPAPI